MKSATETTTIQLGLGPKSKQRVEFDSKAVDFIASFGPYLITDNSIGFFDARVEQASRVLGYNASPLFGIAHSPDNWTDNPKGATSQGIAHAYRELILRKIECDQAHVRFCRTGMDAIHTAIGECWNDRASQSANKVITFSGSMADLAHPLSEEINVRPNPISNLEFCVLPFPGTRSSVIEESDVDDSWIESFSACTKDQTNPAESDQTVESDDPLRDEETRILRALATSLSSGTVFAILFEPFQEDDLYSTKRFNTALINLSRAYNVPLIYDEIQTGFHLGRTFFWHQMFHCADKNQKRLSPDYVACGDRAGCGVLVSQKPVATPDTYSATQLHAGYINASVVEQYPDQIERIEQASRFQLESLRRKFSRHIRFPRCCGLAAGFEFIAADVMDTFLQASRDNGLLLTLDFDQTVQFRFNLACRDHQLNQFWEQLDRALTKTFKRSTKHKYVSIERDNKIQAAYEFHQTMACLRFCPDSSDNFNVVEFVQGQLGSAGLPANTNVVVVNRENYSQYRQRIFDMQDAVYEPARRSPTDEFDALFDPSAFGFDVSHANLETPLSLLVIQNDDIIAMASAGSLQLFKREGGVSEDPFLQDPTVDYVLDLTVAKQHRGGLGRIMKQAIIMLAIENGVSAIHGRNRDRWARGMWAINLSLGSYELNHLPNNYLDDDQFRDCFYYRCPLEHNAISNLSRSQICNELPILINSASVNETSRSSTAFLDLVKSSAGYPSASHIAVTSSLDDSLGRIVRELIATRAPRHRLLVVGGSQFGNGGFLVRALSGESNLFHDVQILTPPEKHDADFLNELGQAIATDDCLALFADADQLARISGGVQLCREREFPVIVNESCDGSNHDILSTVPPNWSSQCAHVAQLANGLGILCCIGSFFAQERLPNNLTGGSAFGLARLAAACQNRLKLNPPAEVPTTTEQK